jgi:tRNA threonylcarbamoyladenosine modification (KEOPS) complex  Pcc1 subunit
MLMRPLKISFGLKRPKCELSEAIEEWFRSFNAVMKRIGSRYLIQEALSYNVYKTRTRWKLLKDVKTKDGERVTLAFGFKDQSLYKAPSAGWLRLIEKCNEICENYLTREHEDMSSVFGSWEKLRLNRVVNAIWFEYPDYEDPAINAETGERKRVAKGDGKTSKKTVDADKEKDESDGGEEPFSGPEKKKAKTSSKKSATAQEQGKGSATTTSSMGCTRVLEVMTQPLPFSPLSPLGLILIWFVPTAKGTNEGGQSLKDKEISYEEVESPCILVLRGAAFGGSSSSEEDNENKTTKGSESSGH